MLAGFLGGWVPVVGKAAGRRAVVCGGAGSGGERWCGGPHAAAVRPQRRAAAASGVWLRRGEAARVGELAFRLGFRWECCCAETMGSAGGGGAGTLEVAGSPWGKVAALKWRRLVWKALVRASPLSPLLLVSAPSIHSSPSSRRAAGEQSAPHSTPASPCRPSPASQQRAADPRSPAGGSGPATRPAARCLPGRRRRHRRRSPARPSPPCAGRRDGSQGSR